MAPEHNKGCVCVRCEKMIAEALDPPICTVRTTGVCTVRTTGDGSYKFEPFDCQSVLDVDGRLKMSVEELEEKGMVTECINCNPYLVVKPVTTSTDADPKEKWVRYVQVGEPVTGLKPHKCPVCEGRGLVPNNFYCQLAELEDRYDDCRSCKGAGYLLIK